MLSFPEIGNGNDIFPHLEEEPSASIGYAEIGSSCEKGVCMDRSTVMGIGLGLLALGLALALGQVPLGTLLNPEALVIVFGGTAAATLAGNDMKTLRRALSALGNRSPETTMPLPDTINYVMDVVTFIRDEGILALQPVINSIEIPFFKKGLQLTLDNRNEKFIRESLSTEIEVNYRDQLSYARVFESAGGFAPTMGIIGAVIGLIYIVQTFNDPAHLGKGVASAFSATLYGLALSNLFLLPLAGKLRQRARDEWFLRTLLLEAVLSIRSGEHPILIRERLNAFTSGNAADKENPYVSQPVKLENNGILPPHAVMDDNFLQIGSGS